MGEPDEGSDVVGGIPVDKIYKILPRPLDYDLFISSVNSSTSQNAGEKKQILIVDDDPNYMGLVREWLVSDYKVFMVTSGSRAIKWLAANKADLILLDYEMPVMSGPELFEELRKDEKTKDIPVFFLTGSDSKEREMSIAKLNPQGYFLKTMPKDELLSQVKGFFITAT